jgi:hypothetical protein
MSTTGILPSLLTFDPRRLDEVSTSLCRAIEAVLGCVLHELAVPGLLEVQIEEPLNVLGLDMVFGAALWWHMRGVIHR